MARASRKRRSRGGRMSRTPCIRDVLVATLAASIAGALFIPVPAAAQGVICCNQLIDVKGSWVGAGRKCNMQALSEGQRAMVCEKLSKAGVTCEPVEPYCKGCDKEAIAKARADYERLLKTYQEIRANADAL